MNKKIMWIGNRESEILYSDLCYKSCTIYDSNEGNNNSYINNSNKSIVDFIIISMKKALEHEECQFLFYSNILANKIIDKEPSLKGNIINKFNSDVLKFIDDKTYSHLWANNLIPIIEFTEMFGMECNYTNIRNKFSNYKKFIIQENHSSGGNGTFLLTEKNEQEISPNLMNHICYIVSPYYEHSYSINTHIIISDKDICVLPPSIQIIENIDNRLLYKGADFIAYKRIPDEIKSKVKDYAREIGKALKKIGYIGILGLDLLVQNNKVYFLEINPRFQASSILINKALKENDYPDLQTIINNIFSDIDQSDTLKKIEQIDIKYSTLSFYQNSDISFNTFLLNSLKSNTKNIDCVIEENINTNRINDYMFRVIFKTNIASVNFDGEIFIYQNLLNYSKYKPFLKTETYDFLKCALLTQGVIIHANVYELFSKNEIIKKATFDAVDITIDDEHIVNCPTNTKFVELSPFSIRKIENKLGLFYIDHYICNISISFQEKLPIKHTQNNIYIHRIGYLTTDRLRIKHTSNCYFKKQNLVCKFCHITSKYNDEITIEDIYQTIDCYSSNVEFRHFLIGGPSNSYENEEKYITKTINYIRNKSNKPIYIMSIPPKSIETIRNYFHAGANEVAFNIEIFDRKIAKEIMPGKGAIPIEQYETILKESSKLFGRENTRSMLIIGLDSYSSLLRGIEFLCKNGVTPMISPFRPMYNTELSDFVPPTIEYNYNIFMEAKKICRKYGVELGPKCKYCRNNTLA